MKSKQIESLVASKIVTNDDMMFIKKTQLEKIGNFKVEKYGIKSELPSTGDIDTLYIVLVDETNDDKTCIYVYKNSKYEMVSGSGAGTGGECVSPSITTNSYVKDIVVSDWVDDAGTKKVNILASEHNQSTDSILVVVFDGETNVIVPYTVDADKNVSVYSQSGFDGKIIVSDLISHIHGNVEVLDKFSQDSSGGLLFDGSPIKGGGGGNPLMLEPLEFGHFKVSGSTKTIASQNVDITPINNENVADSNMTLMNDGVKLKAGKTYSVMITGKLNSDTSGYTSIAGVFDGIIIADALVFNKTAYNNNNGIKPTTHTIYTPSTDSVLKVGTMSSIAIGMNVDIILTVQEIRSNPVNQYGGFETEVLFDGNANAVGEYDLSDDVNNYDFVYLCENENAEIDLIPAMITNTTPTPYNITTSSEYSSEYTGFYAFDKKNKNGSPNDSWASLTGDNKTAWIKIDCGVSKVVDSCKIRSRYVDGGGLSGVPNNVIISGSDDNISNYVELYNGAISNWGLGEEKIFELKNKPSYRYYKFTFASATPLVCINEISLCEIKRNVEKNNTIIRGGNICFESDNVLVDFDCDKMNICSTKIKINKVIGIKGQLPTALVGGTF